MIKSEGMDDKCRQRGFGEVHQEEGLSSPFYECAQNLGEPFGPGQCFEGQEADTGKDAVMFSPLPILQKDHHLTLATRQCQTHLQFTYRLVG